MANNHRLKLNRVADVYDEEALAALVLSGQYLAFLPDHFASRFEHRGEMRRIRPDIYTYVSDHWTVVRRAPKSSGLVITFLNCLRKVHQTAYRGIVSE